MNIPTTFMPSFPCFALFNRECTGPYLVESTDNERAIVVVTDEDLLDRLRGQHEVYSPSIRFDNPVQFAQFLDSLPENILNIAFDPGASRALTCSISDFVKKIHDFVTKNRS